MRRKEQSVGVKSERGGIGQGLYSLADLRLYIALTSPDNATAARDANRTMYWLWDVLLPVGHQPKRPDYSFGDLISLFVVRELLRKGVPKRNIQTSEAYLRRKWNTDRPFTSGEIQTDGFAVYVDDNLINGQIESADREGQQTMRELVRERLATVHYDDDGSGRAAYWTPSDHILIDPRVQFGEPVVAGTRIPTAAVADMSCYAAPQDIERDLKLTASKVAAALAFERRLAALRN